MKKTLAALILFVFAVPFSAMAHTGLSSSNPAEGEQISEPLEEINLIFETQIEAGSTMALESEGQSFKLDEISASGNTLQGQLVEDELPNGDYTLAWSIIGEDGHPIKGEVRFEVAVEAEPAEPAAEGSTVEESPAEESVPVETAAPNEEVQAAEPATHQTPEESNVMGTILIAILAIAVAAIAFKVFKMKKSNF